jgi:hypothetical protein
VIVAQRLSWANVSERNQLVAAVQSLVSSDQLLQRDGVRYLQQRMAAEDARGVAFAATRARSRAPQLVREFQLPQETNWLTFEAAGDYLFAAGTRAGQLDLRMFDWQGNGGVTTANRPLPPDMKTNPQLAADPRGHGPLLVCIDGGRVPRFARVAAGGRGQDKHVYLCENNQAGDADSAFFVGLTFAFGRATFLERDGTSTAVTAKFRSLEADQGIGPIQAVWEVIAAEPGNVILPIHGRHDLLAIGNRSQLLLVRGEHDVEEVEFANHISQITGTSPFTRTRLAVVTWDGASILWPQESRHTPPVRFAHDLHIPIVCFTPSGRLIAVAEGGGEIYDTTNGKLALHSRMPALNQRPLAVLPTNEPDQFALILPGRIVRIYKWA